MLRASEGDVHEQGVSAGVQVQSERGDGGVGVPGADGLEDGRVSVGERDEVYVGLRSNLADTQLGFAHYGLVHASQARAPGSRDQCPMQSYIGLDVIRVLIVLSGHRHQHQRTVSRRGNPALFGQEDDGL